MGRTLVVGLGVAGTAVARTLRALDEEVVVLDDHPTDQQRETADFLGLELLAAPTREAIESVVETVDAVIPSPGVPERHPVFDAARACSVPVRSELELAAILDGRPLVAVTGTNGKTTVTTMVTEMLVRSGRSAIAAGNTDLPLVTAIADPGPELFVVEASSFQLGNSEHFSPRVGAWLNFAPDHLDVHASLGSYEAAKARIWADLDPTSIAVANRDDPIVMSHVPGGSQVVTFGAVDGDYRVLDGHLVGPGEEVIVPLDELPRALPHDQANSLAAAAIAEAAGADRAAVAEVLRSFGPLAHRVERVGEHNGIVYYDDSKATVPHATLAAVRSFASVVLICGGRNKGLDLSVLRGLVPHLRSVVAIGEAAPQIEDVFSRELPVVIASSMADAVAAAATAARRGDVVLLSPACASFDWYQSYSERGDDYQREVGRRFSAAGSES
jgi:UDP-N-acetylmuramoylalanine--D-glutamate ligase